MNFNNFTIKSQEAVQKAVDMATRRSQQVIEPTHLLLGVMDVGESLIGYLFQKLGVNTVMLKSALDREVESLPKVSGGEPFLSRESNMALQKAVDYSSKLGDQFVPLEAIIMAILQTSCTASTLMKDAGIAEKELGLAIDELRKGQKVKDASAEDTYNRKDCHCRRTGASYRAGRRTRESENETDIFARYGGIGCRCQI